MCLDYSVVKVVPVEAHLWSTNSWPRVPRRLTSTTSRESDAHKVSCVIVPPRDYVRGYPLTALSVTQQAKVASICIQDCLD